MVTLYRLHARVQAFFLFQSNPLPADVLAVLDEVIVNSQAAVVPAPAGLLRVQQGLESSIFLEAAGPGRFRAAWNLLGDTPNHRQSIRTGT